ncbi:MAG: ATP-binding cassette domain-containing protein [Halieaceae bacterium]|nr:ATP-binding cassette domain-containing protein [Halieaceae bacterium]
MTIQVQVDLVLSDFNLSTNITLPNSGIVGIFGESGSGKTSLARTIAGLEKSATGLVRFRETIWQDTKQKLFIPTYERQVGFVFQDSILFPHLSVQDNLMFGYKRRSSTIDLVDVEDVIELFDLANLLNRDPASLSGGETQRAVIAQAVLGQPQLLIMDEPMTGLDHHRRKTAVLYIEKLHEVMDIPILYITHSIRELDRLASHLVVIEHGSALKITDAKNYIETLMQENF